MKPLLSAKMLKKDALYKHFPFLLLLFVGVFLRIFHFYDWSLSNDELSAIYRLNFDGLFELLDAAVRIDGHPAFTQVFLFYWCKLFGTSEFWLRLPFVLAGIGAMVYFYLFSKNFIGKKSALIALSFFVVSQIFIQYSQLARPYSFGLFFVLGFAFYWDRLLKEESTKTRVLAYLLFGALGLISHYFATLMIACLMLAGTFFLTKKNWKTYVAASSGVGLLFLPHLSITLGHLKIGGISWLPSPSDDFLFLFFQYCSNNSLFLLLFFSISAIISGMYYFKKAKLKTLLLFGLFFIPYAIAYYYSTRFSPVLQFSVLLFFTPFMILALSSFFEPIKKRWIQNAIIFIILIGGIYSLINSIHFYEQRKFANFKGVAEKMANWSNQFAEKKVLIITNCNHPVYLEHYLSKKKLQHAIVIEKFDSIPVSAKARDLIQFENYEMIILAFANVPIPKEVVEFAKNEFSTIVHREKYFNSEALLLSKGEKRNPLWRLKCDPSKTNPNWNKDTSLVSLNAFYSSPSSFFIKKTDLYSLTFKDKVQNVFTNDDKDLVIEAQLKMEQPKKALLVVEIKRGDDLYSWEAVDINDFRINDNWFQFIHVFSIKEDVLPSDTIQLYWWNPDGNEFYIDDYSISFYAESDYDYYSFK